MLDRVGNVDVPTRNSGSDKGFVQYFSCGSDEWVARDVFFVSGLLADQHDSCPSRSLTENGLG